jgi:hypothetical protein
MTTMVVMSMVLPEPLTGLDIGQSQNEKHESEDDHQKIEHRKTPSLDRRAAGWKAARRADVRRKSPRSCRGPGAKISRADGREAGSETSNIAPQGNCIMTPHVQSRVERMDR